MPVAFLTDDQAFRYGRYTEEPTSDQLARYFYLDDADRALIMRRREDHIRLGFAVQLGTVRFLNTFLTDPTDVPAGVVTHLSRQLNINDPSYLARYLERPVTPYEHAREIKRHYGYQDFHSRPEYFRLIRWLYSRAWLSAERPSVLFDLTTARLVEKKILLPGVTVLERLVARVRDRAALRLWRLLAALPSSEQRARLEALLWVPEGSRQTPLDRLRRAPTRISAPALVQALQRIEEFRALDIGHLSLRGGTTRSTQSLSALCRGGPGASHCAYARRPAHRHLACLCAGI